MSKVESLTIETLIGAVEHAVALRFRGRLQPAGGQGDKIFPPTFEGGKYAFENRRMEGEEVRCVLVDSVQSQANRIEESLLEAGKTDKFPLPIVQVDFASKGFTDIGMITSLDAPHRLADAILRDSELDGTPFRETEQGQILDGATVRNATQLFGICPTALLFGLWDSAGPRGGLGTKFQRALTSSIVGINAVEGVRPSSRIDPLQIQSNSGILYESKTGGWTLKPDEAVKEKGKPKKLGKDGKPSEAIHGNVKPSLAGNHGGVTMDYALQTVVISLAALRRLRFPVGEAGDADVEARTVLAALGLCGVSLSLEKGCDLRSRCVLVPEPDTCRWEIIRGNGTADEFTVTGTQSCELLNEAINLAERAALPWMNSPLTLSPSAKLIELLRRSQELELASQGQEEG